MSTNEKGAPGVSSSSFSWKEWTVRLEAYVSWVNSQLKKHPGYKAVTDLRNDLQDGVVISQLIEVLAGERLVGIDPSPSTASGCKRNVDRIFQFLLSKRVPIPVGGAKDVVAGELKAIMRLIHAVASYYRPDSVLNPPSRPSTSLSRLELSSGQHGMNNSPKTPGSSLGRYKQKFPPRKIVSGSALPIRKPNLSVGQVRKSTSSSSLSLNVDEVKSLDSKSHLRKSLGSLNAERLARAGVRGDGATRNGSSASDEVSHEPCTLSLSHVRSTTNIPNKMKKESLFASKSEPPSLLNAVLKNPEDNSNITDQKRACLCTRLPVEGIDKLLEDIKVAKIQLVQLQEMLLSGNGGRVVHRLDKSASYETIDESSVPSPSTVGSDKRGTENDESFKTKPQNKESPSSKRNFIAENDKLQKQIEEKDQEIKRLKAALTPQALGFEKTSKFPFFVSNKPQREELQVVHEALSSLRKCFPANDPYQHTLDTIEQSLSALLERVNSLETATVPSSPVSGPLSPTACDTAISLRLANPHNPKSSDARRLTIPCYGLNAQPTQENKSHKENSTKVVYYMDKSATPFRCLLNKRIGEATLRDFKLLFDRPGRYRYHFKTLDTEFGMVKEEILFDDDILPGWDDKIIAWVEEESS